MVSGKGSRAGDLNVKVIDGVTTGISPNFWQQQEQAPSCDQHRLGPMEGI